MPPLAIWRSTSYLPMRTGLRPLFPLDSVVIPVSEPSLFGITCKACAAAGLVDRHCTRPFALDGTGKNTEAQTCPRSHNLLLLCRADGYNHRQSVMAESCQPKDDANAR